MQWRVYVDEAGDRGISPNSSKHFVVSGIVVPDAQDTQARLELAALRQALGRKPGQTLHFQNFTHSQRLKAAQDVAKFAIGAISNVIISKAALGQGQPAGAGNLAYVTNPDPMYLWGVRLLLERISWYIRDHGAGSAIVTFGQIVRFPAAKLHNYRQALEYSDTEIWWPAYNGHPFRIEAPNKIELLQVADTAASALFRAVEPDQYGNTEDRYLKELAPKLYRRSSGNVVSYGLKVFPTHQSDVGGPLDWLRKL